MSFRFGDGRVVKSVKCMRLPINLCDKDLILVTYVVSGRLPLLFSRQSLKDYGVSLDIENDKIVIDGVLQDLIVTDSGHYVTDLIKKKHVSQIMLTDVSDPKKVAIKLHRYFGHPTSRRLVELIKNSKYDDKLLKQEIIKLIVIISFRN